MLGLGLGFGFGFGFGFGLGLGLGFSPNPNPNPNQVLSAEHISVIIHKLLGGELLPSYDEALRIELLKLATLLIEHVSEQLVEHRKELP